MRYPYRERFRLIFNELGAGVAGRGQDLAEIIDRANPALRQTDRVLAILANQNRQLAELAVNGDTVLEPLAREREHVTGFLRNAAVAGEATAERSADLEEGLQKLPSTLHQVRLTMAQLKRFGQQGTPLFADLRAVAPDLNLATKKLAPFARAGAPALESLGDAADEVGPDLVEADDLILDLRTLGKQLNPASKELKKVLATLNETGGLKYVGSLIFNVSAAVNGYDNFGHAVRANLLVTACVDYQSFPLSGCIANWGNVVRSGAAAIATVAKQIKKADVSDALPAPKVPGSVEELPELDPDQTTTEPDTPSEGGDTTTTTTPTPDEGEPGTDGNTTANSASERAALPTRSAGRMDDAGLLLEFLLGSGS